MFLIEALLWIIAWVVAGLLTLIGGVWWFFNSLMRPLHQAEVELMSRNHQLYEGEPEAMQNFHILQSVIDLEKSDRSRRWAKGTFLAGLLMLLGLTALTFLRP